MYMVLTKNTKVRQVHSQNLQNKLKKKVKLQFLQIVKITKEILFVSRDICEIHEKMFDVKEKGVYNIGTGTAIRFKEVADLIAQKHNAEIKYIFIPK